MMNSEIIIGILGAIFGGGLFSFVEFLIKRKDTSKKVDICLMGIIIRNACENAIKDNGISLEKLKQLQEANTLYKTIGGNGYIKTLMSKVETLPIIED